jgi:hypothetical protein
MSYSSWPAICDMRSAVIITRGGERGLATEAPLSDAVALPEIMLEPTS